MCTPTSSVDLVVRVGPRADDQLRYTLRSLSRNLPHARILTAGCRPPWTSAEHIAVPHAGGKFLHAYAVLRAILVAEDLTPSVVIADDDMYLMRPLEVLPEYHRGPLSEIVPLNRKQGWADTLNATPDALCRDAHVPTLVDRNALATRLDALDLPLARRANVWWRTLVGGGCTQIGDVKVRLDPAPTGDPLWLSTSDSAWRGEAGRYVAARFPDTCEVEAA